MNNSLHSVLRFDAVDTLSSKRGWGMVLEAKWSTVEKGFPAN